MKRTNRAKWMGMMIAGGMMFQLGCSIDGLFRHIQIGFAQAIGAIPGALLGEVLNDAIGIVGGDGTTE